MPFFKLAAFLSMLAGGSTAQNPAQDVVSVARIGSHMRDAPQWMGGPIGRALSPFGTNPQRQTPVFSEMAAYRPQPTAPRLH